MSTNAESTLSDGMYSKLIDNERSYLDESDASGPGVQHNSVLSVTPWRGASRQGGQGSYRLASMCLAVLCAVLLISLVAVSAYSRNQAQGLPGPQVAPQNQSEGQTQMQTQSADVAVLTESLAKLHKERDDLQKERDGLQKERDDLQKERDDLQKERDQLLTQTGPQAVTSAPKSPATTIPCAHPWLQFNSSCYYISSFSDSWEDGQNFCQEMDGHLAIIHTPEEQTFVWDQLPRGHWNAYWFGLSDESTEDDWVWVDGTKLVGGFWEKGEPNNHIDEDCGYIVKTQVLERKAIQSWYDAPCSMHWPFICEKEMGAPQ
ncbi:C-type lectin domain family 4 member F-like [Osmerus mordax]|uniref:C-type lectin domain family 4 member F-like n=1 Tax=Osmerus mordax TaxID=8014 RepID=UPI00350EB8E3